MAQTEVNGFMAFEKLDAGIAILEAAHSHGFVNGDSETSAREALDGLASMIALALEDLSSARAMLAKLPA